MTLRERIADWISGGALSVAQYKALRWEAVAMRWEQQAWRLIDEKAERAERKAREAME